MTIEVVIPVEDEDSVMPGTVAQRGRGRDPVTLGVVDNGKHRARRLLTMLGERLVEEGVASDLLVLTKPAPGKIMPNEPRSEMAARARLVISGVGD